MADSTCSVEDCDGKPKGRGLCKRHYNLARHRKQLPPLQLELPYGRHSLSNIDREARIADCAICGPRVPIRVNQARGYANCKAIERAGAKRYAPRRAVLNQGYWRQAKYGISDDDYDRMYAQQDGCCCICRTAYPRLFVDHDHATGAVRGLLCRSCNIALGWLHDNPETAMSAALYLRASG